MGWIDVVGGCELDTYGAKVNLPRYLDEADAEYRTRLKQAPSPSDTRDYGGSAFPEPGAAQCGGMTLRDYFAAKVFAASIAGGYWSAEGCTSEHMAMMAYKHADNLLAERAK